jgi:galactose-1-phosphate uridylyltransferase
MTDPVRYRAVKKRARLHDPRRDFALTEIEAEVRYDPLTGDSARICHFGTSPREIPDLAPLVASSKAHCPFCPDAVARVTPRYPDSLVPGGRMARGEALLVPNLFPYDDVSAILVMCQAHFLPMDSVPPETFADALKLAREFIMLAEPSLGERPAYGIVTWNYMPPSGASQVHSHLQVIVTDTPGNALRRELEAEALFALHHGAPFARALVKAERGAERWLGEEGGVAWWVPYCPFGMLGDAQAVFLERASLTECSDGEIDAFARFLTRLLTVYARLGFWSFNLSLLPDARAGGTNRHRLTARLLPRFYLNPDLHNSDVAYLQLLLGEKFAMQYPEAHAAALRGALR